MQPIPAEPLFVFGTLLDAEVLGEVLAIDARELQQGTGAVGIREAFLPGYAAHVLRGQNYPILRKTPESVVRGHLLDGLTAEHWHRLVWFEGSHYDLDPCRVGIDAQAIDSPLIPARVFASENRALATGDRWRLEHWQQAHKHDYLIRARLWMRQRDAENPLADEVVWLAPLDNLHAQGVL